MVAAPPSGTRKSSFSKKVSGLIRSKRVTGWKKLLLGLCLLALVSGTGVFVYAYVRFSRLINARLSGNVFDSASLIFAAPVRVTQGQPATPEEFASRLRRAGYSEGGSGPIGSYRIEANRLQVEPGPRSFFRGELAREGPAELTFEGGRLASIAQREPSTTLQSYLLEPEILTTLFDRTRAKRRLVRYQDLPRPLVQAILASEDHRFFSHHGVNIYRMIAAVVTDLRGEERPQGGSTLTMQLARNFFLTPRRTIKRKLAEIFIAILLEQRLSKEQIFEFYANQIYLGQRGSFSIYGVGEAAGSYFNKDVKSLTLPEAALLVGITPGPNLFSPYRYPGRALERRNLVLKRMVETHFITPAEAEKARETPLNVARQNVEGAQAPFFVDMVRDQLLAQFSERDLLSQSYRIYTTLDPDLQRVASEAVRAGILEVDQQIAKRRRKGAAAEPNQPQVALVVLDPSTGALKALVGGRDYGVSQLNHVLARRQPGSSFKPFVYAAALNSAVSGAQPLITSVSTLVDEPTTFQFGNRVYEPENYKHEFHGEVTVREALTHSLNVATVRLAETIGYDKVRNLAVAAGINQDVQATPAIALGAYVATPLEITGAYTIFSNRGKYVSPNFVLGVNDSQGRTLWRSPVTERQVLDPRVSYLVTSLLESVVNNGTGAGVRSRGFTAAAAGKTGTSHDGWFAGFTSDLLAVVWVGYDDDRELGLEGARSALPVWADFMKRAIKIPAYQSPHPFIPPPGVVTVPVEVHTSSGTTTQPEVFIEGTEPQAQQPAEKLPGILTRIFHPGASASAPGTIHPPMTETDPAAAVQSEAGTDSANPKKGGVLKKFLSIFKGKGSEPEQNEVPQKKTNP